MQGSEAIVSLEQNGYFERLMRLADAQKAFLERYAPMIPNDRERDYFQREFMYLIHLVYREAQEPLVKHITDLMTRSRFLALADVPFTTEVLCKQPTK